MVAAPVTPPGAAARLAPIMVRRRSQLRSAAGATAVFAFAALLSAHGGQYRGPWNAPAPPPWTGGPAGPAGPGPSTGGRPSISDGTSWQVWWEFNKDELVASAPSAGSQTVTGSDEFYLGLRRAAAGRDTAAPTADDRRDRIAAGLAAALRSDDQRDVVTACLVALAKVGVDPPGHSLPDLFSVRLTAADQEVRETATLALGIAGKQKAFATLAALLAGDSAGKVLAGGKDKDVPDRTRTFAAWALGLLAGRSRDPAQKRAAAELLLGVLQDAGAPSRDLRVGAAEALGLLAPSLDRGSEKLLAWQIVDGLWKFYGQDLGKGDQLVQAHASCAVARLLGRGNSPAHQRAKSLLVTELFADGRHNAIRQSAAMALGTLCLPEAAEPADAEIAAALQRGYEKCTDQLTRFFCVLSLGRIGGHANRLALLRIYVGAGKFVEKPWVALALGLIARARLQAGEAVDAEFGRTLLHDLQTIDGEDAQAAIAVALGLCGYREAAPALASLLRAGSRNDTLMGYLAVGLALLDHVDSADDLVALMRDSVRRPFVLQQCALALGRLGDVRTVPTLLTMLDESQSTATLSAIAGALGRIRDRRSIDPLLAVLADRSRTDLARAFAAAALGGIGDKDPVPWNAAIARDTNYMATVDTLTNGSTGVLDIL